MFANKNIVIGNRYNTSDLITSQIHLQQHKNRQPKKVSGFIHVVFIPF